MTVSDRCHCLGDIRHSLERARQRYKNVSTVYGHTSSSLATSTSMMPTARNASITRWATRWASSLIPAVMIYAGAVGRNRVLFFSTILLREVEQAAAFAHLPQARMFALAGDYSTGRIRSQTRLSSPCRSPLSEVMAITAFLSGTTMMYCPRAPSARKHPGRQRHI